jgi:hypothetical protein
MDAARSSQNEVRRASKIELNRHRRAKDHIQKPLVLERILLWSSNSRLPTHRLSVSHDEPTTIGYGRYGQNQNLDGTLDDLMRANLHGFARVARTIRPTIGLGIIYRFGL